MTIRHAFPRALGDRRLGRRLLCAAATATFTLGACSSDSSDPGAQQIEVDDTEVEDTEVDDTEVDDTEVEDTEVEDTEVEDTEVEDTDGADNATRPPELVEQPATSTTAVPDTTAPTAAPTGGNTVDDLLASARSVYGPSTDAVAAIAAFLPVPAGIPTPDGADVFAFSARIDPGSGDELITSGDVTFSAPGTLTDLATFYETTLTAAGYTRTGSADDTTSAGEPVKRLEFAIPGSDWGGAGVEVTIIDRTEVRTVEIQIDDRPDQAAAAAAKERLGAWADSFPGRGADVVDYQVSLSVQTVSGPYIVLGNAGYGTLPRADQVAAIVGAVPDGTYTIDPSRAPTEGEVALVREGFDEVVALVGEPGSLGTLVNVSMQADL